jgi:hypothetical protein
MSHPYLNLSWSATYPGKYVVGKTNRQSPYGDGLINKSVTVVEIPSTFNGIEIAEIGHLSFYLLGITSVFIPKTVLQICQEAFNGCRQLTEVRFEEGSKLQKLEIFVFYQCTSLKKIDFPASITTILIYSGYAFFYNVALDCFSYAGTTDFSSLNYFFNSVSTVYVSNSYPSSAFAGKTVIKGTQTCGVSKEHFEKPNTGTVSQKCPKYSVFLIRNCAPYYHYMFFLLCS